MLQADRVLKEIGKEKAQEYYKVLLIIYVYECWEMYSFGNS